MKNFHKSTQQIVFIAFLFSILTAFTPAAWARSQIEIPYPADEVWATTVRFIRVDMGFEIHEKERDAGYILFDYLDGSQKHKSSIELVATRESTGRASSKLVMTITDLPRHVEGTMLDKLSRKVREELGAPAPPPPKTPPREKKPADKDDKRDDDEPADDKRDKLPRPETGDLPRAPHTDKLPR